MISSLRRPTRSDRYPLGITAEMLPIANVASASPAIPGPWPSASDDEQRHQRHPQAERRPARREVRQQRGPIRPLPQRHPHRHRRLGLCCRCRQRRVPQADEHHGRRDQQRDAVDDERRAQPESHGRAPSTGPPTEPSRNDVENIPATRPRASVGMIRIIKPSAETKNIVDPIPPSDRNSSSCQYV